MKTKTRTPFYKLSIQPEKTHAKLVSYLVLFQRKSGRKRLISREKLLKDFLDQNGIPYFFLALDELASSEALDIGALQRLHGFNRVIVVGGDGTIRRVAEHIYFHELDLPIAIIPSGSANTLGHILGISSFAKARQTLIDGQIGDVYAGILNEKSLFLIAASFGHISLPTIRAHDYYKHQIGFLAYILAGIPLLFHFRRTIVRLLDSDEELKAHSIVALPYKGAKALRILSRETTGLNILIFKGTTFLNFLLSTLLLFVRHRESKSVEIKHAQQFSFTGNFTGSVHLDGDIIDTDGNNYKLETAKKPLRFLVPPEGKRVL